MRVLLIGAGAVVEGLYCPALRRLERAKALRVLGVVDPSGPRARAVSQRFVAARAYADCGDAFDTGGSYDLAIVASPPGLHADHTCMALERGSHVLCEKPMTTSLSDAKRMEEVAERTGRMLGVVFPRRFYSNFADVAKLVAAGELGDELRFTFREGDTYGWPVTTGAAFQREKAGGGVLLDKGIHMLDQLSWIFGKPALERSYDDSLVGGVETNAILELAFPQARGMMQVSWEYPLNNGLRIWGSLGEVMLDGQDLRNYLRKTDRGWVRVPSESSWPADLVRNGGKQLRPGNYHACVDVLLIAMLRAILYSESYPVAGHQAVRLHAAIDNAYENSQPMAHPWLSEAEQRVLREKHWKGACAE